MIADYMLLYTDAFWVVETMTEVLLALWFLRHFERRWKHPAATVGIVAAFTALWYGVHLLHVPSFWYDFVLCTLVMALYVFAAHRTRCRQAVYSACVFVLCLELGKIVCVDLLLQPFFPLLVDLSAATVTLLWTVGMLAAAFASLAVVSYWMFRWPIEHLSWGQLLLTLFPLVPYVYIRSSGYMFDLSNERLYWDMVFVALLFGVSTLAVVVANAQSMAAQARKTELAQMRSLLQEQHLQYEAQRKASDALRRLHHDLKHLVNSPELCRDDLARRIGRELEPLERGAQTGNEILDVVLSQKKARCLEAAIRPVFFTDARTLSFLSSYELCAIFGNILDNAIEATRQMERAEEREINLDIRQVSGVVAIQCRNPYRVEPITKDGAYLSTKTDEGYHGFGIKSVQEIVLSREGCIDIDASDGLFVVTITLPIPEA